MTQANARGAPQPGASDGVNDNRRSTIVKTEFSSVPRVTFGANRAGVGLCRQRRRSAQSPGCRHRGAHIHSFMRVSAAKVRARI